MSSHPFLHRLRRPATIAAAAALGGTSIAYAAGVVGAPAPAPAPRAASTAIELVDDDGGTPMFSLAAMRPGETAVSCIAVTNRSAVPVDVALNARRSGDLDPFIGLGVERGTAPATPSRSCAGFSPEAQVFAGTLSSFPAESQPGLADGALGAGGTRVYRYTATLGTDNAAQAKSATVDFLFSGTGEPPKPKPTPTPAPTATPAPSPAAEVPIPIETKPGESCTTYYLAAAVRRSVKIGPRIKAQLTVTQSGRGTAKEALIFKVGLRTRTGKTLMTTGWANVVYKRNGRTVGHTKKRPFTVVMKPSAFKTGKNRVQILIRNRHGQTSRATFVLDFGKALLREQTVCVIRNSARSR